MKNIWQPCPRCESKRVKEVGSAQKILIGLCMMSFGIFFLLIPPIGIAMMLVGLALMISVPFTGGNNFCQDCKHKWKYIGETKEKA
jgi:hypothetical protein